MDYKVRRWIAVIASVIAVLLSPLAALAQDTAPGWSQSEAINTECCASLPVPVTDKAGRLHLFWADDRSGGVMYAQWQGDSWSTPVDVLSTGGAEIPVLDAAYGDDGFLNLVWVDGPGGRLMYSRAWVDDAGSARGWQPPAVLADYSLGAAVRVDSKGRIHVVYSPFEAGQGIMHTSSVDGVNWSEPTSVPSGLVASWAGQQVRLAIGPDDTLHATWNSVAMPGAFPEHAVYYQRSTDGGATWSDPFDLDPLPPEVAANAATNFKNKFSNVAVGADGAIHVTWHQYTGLRWHRMSTDGGLTWEPPEYAFPDLGPAFNGFVDMAFDSGGNMHVGAARGGIWYRQWRPTSGWLPVQLVDGRTPDWHHVRVAVLGGNQLFLFYPDINGTGILWHARRELDTPAIPPEPLPARPVPVEATSRPAQAEAGTTTAAGAADTAATPQPPQDKLSSARSRNLPADLTIVIGIGPSIVLVLAVFLVQSISMRRRE